MTVFSIYLFFCFSVGRAGENGEQAIFVSPVQLNVWWGVRDLNPRPTDHESSDEGWY